MCAACNFQLSAYWMGDDVVCEEDELNYTPVFKIS